MRIIDFNEIEKHFYLLIEQAAKGYPFIIAKAGVPIAKVVPLDTPIEIKTRRLGFLKGYIDVPDDFDSIGKTE